MKTVLNRVDSHPKEKTAFCIHPNMNLYFLSDNYRMRIRIRANDSSYKITLICGHMPCFAMCLHAGSTEVLVTLNTVPSCYLTLQFHINIRQNILKRLIHEKKKKHGYKFWFGNTFAQK